MYGALVGFINSAEQIFVDVFEAPRLFTTIFALAASFMGLSSLLNARIVGRFGTRVISHTALIGYILVSGLHAAVAISGHETLWSFALLQSCMMFCFGLVGPNFGSMAMEPLGHVAGTASSVQGFVSTVGGALVGFYIGQHFNGTVIPLTLGFTLCSAATLVVVLVTEQGKLFRPTASGIASVADVGH
jgi:MFS transporter, DHA1 family, multidrug resistance protein